MQGDREVIVVVGFDDFGHLFGCGHPPVVVGGVVSVISSLQACPAVIGPSCVTACCFKVCAVSVILNNRAAGFTRVTHGSENARGIHAMRVLDGVTDFTIQSVIDAAYDSQITGFEPLIPVLLGGYDDTPDTNPLKAQVAEQVEVLRAWDRDTSTDSVAATLYQHCFERRGRAGGHLANLRDVVASLEETHGTWEVPWGDINRHQRPADGGHSDERMSLPIAGTLTGTGATPKSSPGACRIARKISQSSSTVMPMLFSAKGQRESPESCCWNRRLAS